MANKMALLEIHRVSKQFGSKTIISSLDLNAEEGSIFGFLGPNGAGKTTTIRMIVGILRPTEGKISISGYDTVEDAIQAKMITGYIPDAPYLYPKLTGYEYLELVAHLYGLKNFTKRIFALAERFDLAGSLEYFIDSYSFGMRQKLSIIGAVLPNPKLVVVDEPLIGLDPPAARTVKDLFIELKKDGVLVFMSTHFLEIAELLCDRVGIIDRGELASVGRLDELMKNKNTRLEEIFLRLLAERREEGSDERRRWEALADAAGRPKTC